MPVLPPISTVAQHFKFIFFAFSMNVQSQFHDMLHLLVNYSVEENRNQTAADVKPLFSEIVVYIKAWGDPQRRVVWGLGLENLLRV